MHELDLELKYAMQDHLKLHLSSQEASDEEVLSIYPAAIRRRILRHMYMGIVKSCSLFKVGAAAAAAAAATFELAVALQTP